MGTPFAAIAIIASAALAMAPGGSVLVLIALAAVLAGLGLGALLGARPGSMAAATAMAAFATLITEPFSATGRQLERLGRAAEQGEGAAAALLHLYAGLEPYGVAPLLLVIATILSLFGLATRRSGRGAHGFLLAEGDALAALATRAGTLASFLYLPMIIIIVYDVGQRKYLDLDPGFTGTKWYRFLPSTKLQELEWQLHATLFLMCLGFAYVRDAHVRIDLVRDGLRPRSRAWIELLGCVLFLIPYCYVVASHGYDFARNSFRILERSASGTGLAYRFIIKSMLPIGFILLALAGIAVVLRCIVFLFGPRAPSAFSSPDVAASPTSSRPAPPRAGADAGK
jgi:TRAP-type mannitol/chloroaromatic compound transport system permease small subunit